MPLRKKEQELLLIATENIDIAYRAILRENLISTAESSSWFYDFLFRALKRGLKFYVKDHDTIASYMIKKNEIIIHKIYFDEMLPRKILNELLRIVLRHEVTHAIDHQDQNGSDMKLIQIADARTEYYKDLVDILYDKLVCIDKNHKVNARILDKISQYIYQTKKNYRTTRAVGLFG